ncbi:nitroreductase/quinone reductase family protein [Streptomyces sp. NPDC049954]|uniref:nitroreductase/quinone reductase family protein n=1 Tax=Streptomyces sp. NPDC049954 TaxID=3155779 RepID=UPI00341F9E11
MSVNEPASAQPYYLAPAGFSARVNLVAGWLARHGVSLLGTAELSVRGRTSGRTQRVPVHPHRHGGKQYLVSARGHGQWVRNMRVAGGGELRVGRRRSRFTAVEVPVAERPEVLRSYLKKWGWEVKGYFRGVTADASEEELAAAAPDHPVFLISVER